MFDPTLDDVSLSLVGCCEISDQFLFWIQRVSQPLTVKGAIPRKHQPAFAVKKSEAGSVFHSRTAVKISRALKPQFTAAASLVGGSKPQDVDISIMTHQTGAFWGA